MPYEVKLTATFIIILFEEGKRPVDSKTRILQDFVFCEGGVGTKRVYCGAFWELGKRFIGISAGLILMRLVFFKFGMKQITIAYIDSLVAYSINTIVYKYPEDELLFNTIFRSILW